MKKADLQAGLFLTSNFSRTGVSALHMPSNYAFFGAIESFAAFATRNFTTVFALI
jgi:hypothetical protein